MKNNDKLVEHETELENHEMFGANNKSLFGEYTKVKIDEE